MHHFDDAIRWSDDDELHLHGFENHNAFAGADALARFDSDLPDAGAHRRWDGFATCRNIDSRSYMRLVRRFDEFRLARGCPSFTLGYECRLLAFLERGRLNGNFLQILSVLLQAEVGVLHPEVVFAVREG